ncbi:MAG: hypothetical protein MUE36_00030 [Acidimicrobiales bacterium]|jgi:hypothetical protein|nr:hypothetical protein [Acidimicrobiales bacterium]
MKRILGVVAALTLVLTAGVVSTGSAGAQATSTPVVPLLQVIDLAEVLEPVAGVADIYVVHGLNLDGQSAQGDGGTAVTVCADGDQLLTDFQFGDIAGPVALPWNAEVSVEVYVGADVACGSATPVITQAVTVPEVAAASLVATAGPGAAPALLPVVLDVETPLGCGLIEVIPEESFSSPQGDVPEGRLGAVHAAAAGTVAATVDDKPLGDLGFGDSFFADIVAGTFSVEVTLGGTPIVGPLDVTVEPCTLAVAYVVGNQPLAAPVVPPTEPPAAAAVTARPAFTG